MAHAEAELKAVPHFTTDRKGKPTGVRLGTAAYVALLVRGNVTDPALWPPQVQEGAWALARVRKIEANCIRRHGEFDWEKLSEKLQDEYDSLCLLLDRLQDTGKSIPLSEVLAAAGDEPTQ